jgi:hypothetical protein
LSGLGRSLPRFAGACIALVLIALPAATPAPADVPASVTAAAATVPEGQVTGGEPLALASGIGPALPASDPFELLAAPPLAESVPVAAEGPTGLGEPGLAESVPVTPQTAPVGEPPGDTPPAGEEPPFEREAPPRERPTEEPPAEEHREAPHEEPPHGEEPEAEGEAGESETVEQPQTPGPGGAIIGTNDAAGWGASPASTIREAHITWARVELSSSSTFSVHQTLEDHFKLLAIVGNTNDGAPLATVEPLAWGREVLAQIRAAGASNVLLAEAGNETYLKGGRPEPVQYGRMYMAAIRAIRAAGLHMPLLFNMRGDYQRSSGAEAGTWSRDSEGGGWLHDAVVAVPGLRAAILRNGIAIHPYGALGENNHDTYGVRAAAADETVARRVLGAYPPFYITEFGYDLGACGWNAGACSQEEQAVKLSAAYAEFLADPHVRGIWWYQSHDDTTGQWGFMNRDNSVRPSFGALAQIAAQQGQ